MDYLICMGDRMPKAKLGVFDIDSPERFFHSISSVFETYKASKAKRTEDLLYIIMGLNHLREWIAPGYKRRQDEKNDAQVFYNRIYSNCRNYVLIKEICNATKHLGDKHEIRAKHETSANYGLDIDDWPDFDSVSDFDLGPPSGHFVDGDNVIGIIEDVINYYEREWFSKQHNNLA